MPEGPVRPYRLSGDFVELCDCFSVCPCWIGRSPDDNRCTGAFGWAIREGEIDGVAVAGLVVVSISFHSGHRDTGGQEVFLFVDEGASDPQFEVLTAAFSGAAGGPLGELGTLMGVLRSVERAPIQIVNEGRHVSLTIDRRVAGDAQVLLGSDGEVTELRHGRLATVLGPIAEVGTSSTFTVDLGGAGFGVEVKGRAAMRGPFSYRTGAQP
jgi:hypothetical protein